MGRFSEIPDLHRRQRQRPVIKVGLLGQVGLQGAVHAFKGPLPAEQRLGAEGLLGGTARQQDTHRQLQPQAGLFQHHSRPHSGGGDPVVAAGVAVVLSSGAVAGQRVIFRQKGDAGSLLPPPGGKGGLHALPAPLQGKTLVLQIVRQAPDRLPFLHPQLGVGVEKMRQSLQLQRHGLLQFRDQCPMFHETHRLCSDLNSCYHMRAFAVKCPQGRPLGRFPRQIIRFSRVGNFFPKIRSIFTD